MSAGPPAPGTCGGHQTWANVEVEDWAAEQGDEPLGTKEKFWVKDLDNRPWLFKFARAANDGVISGEDWAECLVHELAKLFGVPTAHTNIASFEDRRGVLSLNVAPRPLRLEHGDELLAATHHDYRAEVIRQNPHHTIRDVQASLDGIGTPPEWHAGPVIDAFDLWAGYLIMDAWVSGTDRHPQNWAAVGNDNSRWLAPSFDHGNALGFQLRDGKREQLLAEPALLRQWTERGRNRYFSGKPPLIDLARQALAVASTEARSHWLSQLHQIDRIRVEATVAQVPRRLLSDVGRSFCVALLMLNRERILHACAGDS